MEAISDTVLKDFSLRSTPNRKEILDLFLQRSYALSHADIENEFENSLDRVTVYRTLKTFLDKGLIHKVLDDGGGIKYALCNLYYTYFIRWALKIKAYFATILNDFGRFDKLCTFSAKTHTCSQFDRYL